MFALEGKFNCVDQMVCEEAERILAVVTERTELILHSASFPYADAQGAPPAAAHSGEQLDKLYISGGESDDDRTTVVERVACPG